MATPSTIALASSAERTFADTSTVTLLVSSHGNVFHIHEHLLLDASPFFKAAFNSKFREASDRTMDLPEDNVISWEQIVRWLYLDECTTEFYILPKRPSDIDLVRIATTYTLAEKYDMIKLKNKICAELYTLPGTISPPSKKFATIIYTNTPPNAPLRRLLADWYVWYSVPSSVESEITQDFLRGLPELHMDVTIALAQMSYGPPLSGWTPFYRGDLFKYVEDA